MLQGTLSEKRGKQKEIKDGVLSLLGIKCSWCQRDNKHLAGVSVTDLIDLLAGVSVQYQCPRLLLSESTNKLILGSSGTFTLITIMSVIHYYPDYCLLAVFLCTWLKYDHRKWNYRKLQSTYVPPSVSTPVTFFFFKQILRDAVRQQGQKKQKQTHSLPKHTDTQHGYTPPRAPACAQSTTQNSQGNYCESQRHPSGTVIRP